jgi:hypothetical protein
MKEKRKNALREKIHNRVEKFNQSPISRADWLLLLGIGLFLYACVFYEDLIIIHDHSITFLDSLFSGDIANFYANTLERPSHGFGAVYYWVPYLIQGIWDLPIYILHKAFGFGTAGVKVYLWIKLGICLMLLLTTWLIGKILEDFEVDRERQRFAQFLFLSSLLVMLPTVAVAQIDINAIFLILLGIREYAKQEKITWRFLLVFSLAATLKIFALFLLLPLIFLREKRVLYVLWDMFVGVWGILLCVIPYAWRQDYKDSTAVLNDVMIVRLFGTQFPAGNTDIPIFTALLVAVCIWCYVKKAEGKRQRFVYAVWIALYVFAAFFIFVFSHPYWIVLISPFLVIIITLNGEGRKLNLLLETILSVAVMFVYHTKFGVFMTEKCIDLMVLPKLGFSVNGTGYTQSSEWIVDHGLDFYAPAMYGVFAVCLIAFLILNRPDSLQESWEKDRGESLKFDHGMITVRFALLGFYLAALLYLAYWG